MVDKGVNAGVAAQQGFALQRNMALFIILDKYESKFNNAKYFLSLEHLEDILFCFLDEKENALNIETYQSKKKSTGSWRINNDFSEIILKILKTGKSLIQDTYPKCANYRHELYFSTNSSLDLEAKNKEIIDGVLKDVTYTEKINEQNSLVDFENLSIPLKFAIDKLLKKDESFFSQNLSEELKNLKFLHIDFNKINKEQENQLRGKLGQVFDKKICDHSAALESIFRLFKKVELAYNQKNQVRLSDATKQLRSEEINKAFNIITTKSKAFDYWRKENSEISKKLKIKPFEKESFEMNFSSALDLFKDKNEAEHQKILNFVKYNYKECKGFSEEDCVDEITSNFLASEKTNLDDLMLKATIYAAYFESICKMEN